MSLAATCPYCAATFRLADTMAGKTVECARCHKDFFIPDPDARPAPSSMRRPVIAPRPPARPVYAPPPEPIVYVEAPAGPRQPLDLQNPYTYVIGACAILIIFFIFIGISNYLHDRDNTLAATPAPAVPSAPPIITAGSPAHTPPAPAAAADDFPSLPAPSHPEPGITCYQLTLPTGAPSTQSMTLILLVPDVHPHPLACVFVAPAGTPLVCGNEIDLSGDGAELYPYVRSGFAACGYSLDGPMHEKPTYRELFSAFDKFRTAQAGLLNARRAMDFVTARAPMVDHDRFLLAGHSSAATVALDVAANDDRVKAVAAYCPCIDIASFNPQLTDAIQKQRPDSFHFFHDCSPINLAVPLAHAPVLLFGSEQDSVVPNTRFNEFAAAINAAGGKATVTIVPTGDHYHAMIEQGIPRGIAFFRKTFPADANPSE